ncbi:HlyD family type I secretion periplasmic adaptor subunit [Cognatiyoonia sp. IB215182]|uniref:HlyD family type I secretion periplasmic adaptor subunit n=1 Tax=Cognatiyoonia sp. IB215182 TaxID=3097353 RepID=UPI002A1815A2|nr:HlyD family type I secretion periplasmic adaptor subunit [Cognatiyoonia sp. IB215182]MDX8352560.1 HlyD family type I secretion periplasmic adaptor subunit [Cognatiyoonia sp. IB215182]
MMKPSTSIWPLWFGIVTLAVFGAGMGIWSTTTEISGAIIGQGRIEPTTSPHVVSHPKGGIVAQVMVDDGDAVQAGDLVARFDQSLLVVEKASVERQLASLTARHLRLEAMRDGQSTLMAIAADHPDQAIPGLQSTVMTEEVVLVTARERLEREHALQMQRTLQVEQQIRGIDAQIEGITGEITVFQQERDRQAALQVSGLVRTEEIAQNRRDLFAKSGERGRLRARRAELEERLAELRLAALAVDDTARKAAQDELDRIAPQILTLIGRRAELLLELRYLDIRAPISGVVHDLKIMGDGFVHLAGQPLLTLVPTDSAMRANVRVSPSDIDQVHLGQTAILRFAAYNVRALPSVTGEVLAIAPDITFDPVTRKNYYAITISVPENMLAETVSREIINGMGVTAFIQTERQTPIEYMTRPIVDYFSTALRDR